MRAGGSTLRTHVVRRVRGGDNVSRQMSLPIIVLGGLFGFAPLIEGGTTHLPVLIIRFTLLAVLAGWVFSSMKSGALTIRKARLFTPLLALLAWSAVCAVRAPYAAPALQWMLSLISYAVLFFLVLHLIESIEQVRKLLLVVLMVGALEALLGVYQVVWGGQPRATGTFFNPNFFAAYEVAALAVALGMLCFGPEWEGQRWERTGVWLSAGLSLSGLLVSQSRGALVACVAAVTFVGCLRFRRAFLGVLVLGALVVLLVPNPMRQRLQTVGAQDPYAYTRLDIWRNSLQRILDRPWGVGPGMYAYTSFRYRFPVEGTLARYAKRAESAHNEYLQMGVELGVMGVAVFAAGIWLVGAEWRAARSRSPDVRERGLLIGMAGGLLGLLTHAAMDSVFHQPALVMVGVLFAGLIVVVARRSAPGEPSVWVVPFVSHPARTASVAALVVLATVLIVRPAAAWYAFDRGETEMKGERVESARSWYQWATRIEPGTTAYRDAIALAEIRLYEQSGNARWLLDAAEEFRIALNLNPLDARLAHREGNVRVLLAERPEYGGRRGALLQQAAAAYEHALRLDPYAPGYYYDLSRVRLAQARDQEAIAWLVLAKHYEPNFLPARVRLAELALQKGVREAALAEYVEIDKVRERYRGQALNSLERHFLEVDEAALKRLRALVEAP